MNVQQLLDILNNRKEIPHPERAEIVFYMTDDSGNEVDLSLKGVGAFAISTDVTMEFEKTVFE